VNSQRRRRLEEAIRRNETTLLRWLTTRLGDADAARDVAQSVYLRIWRYADDTEVENPRALIFKTAANLALNELKRQNRFRSRENPGGDGLDGDVLLNIASPEPSPERQSALREDLAIVMRAIKALPERPRRAFIMSRFEERGYREIAGIMGVSESSVEKYMSEALRVLRLALRDTPPDDKVPESPTGRRADKKG